MNTVIKYFSEEKMQCSMGIVLGLLSVGTAILFLYRFKNPLYNGIAYTFIAVSIILLTICINVVVRSPKDIQRVGSMIQNDVSKIRTEEIPRIEKVIKNFSFVLWVEAACFVLGLVLFILSSTGSLWKGIGIGLLIQASMLFAFDIIAQNRARQYSVYLKTLI